MGDRPTRGGRSAGHRHSAAISCSATSPVCSRADFVAQHTYQEPNRNSSISIWSAITARSFHGLMKRIAEHGALHQPETEGQDQLAAEAGWKLAVHDDDASARTQLRPCVVQHREMVRHGVVAKAEQDAVERLTADV